MLNLHNQNGTFVQRWVMMMRMFNRLNFVVDGADATVAPVFANDVALACMNALKMDETIGQSYDLGGPTEYDYNEIFELFANLCNINPYSQVVKLEEVFDMYHKPWYASVYRQLFRQYLKPDIMMNEFFESKVNPANKGFEDLHIKPVSFGQKAQEHINELYWQNNNYDETARQGASS